MNTILVLLTCFNRKQKTIHCIHTLVEGNSNIKFHFFICDDFSTDGTPEALQGCDNVTLLHGDGNLYYTGEMRMVIAEAQHCTQSYEYVLLVNDDVSFYPGAVESLISQMAEKMPM